MENSDKIREHCLYKEWMSLQEQELSQLLNRSLNLNKTTADVDSDAEIGALVDKITQHFQDYVDSRRRLAGREVSAFFSPRWCTTLENSMLWIAECRPSSFFSLVYALCGADIDKKLSQYFQGSSSEFPQLSSSQLISIDNLQRRTIAEEEKLSSRVASLQQEMADMPLALIARNSGPICEHNSDVRENIGKIEQAMASAMEEADQLRLNTFKELIQILKPLQAVEYIIATKNFDFVFSRGEWRETMSMVGTRW
ncbi:hypothetical protein DH2020_046586 [Rehmannia glutinosa]|uniref:DOG1 domain-containing protein n=1 Tax=Rehmannia glutinosa TaxID=99300 RepID=A0ABR0UBE3_REHGL